MMNKIILLILGIFISTGEANVSLYFVEGLDQFPVESKSITHWCYVNLQSGNPDDAASTSDVFGVLYEPLIKNQKSFNENLPDQITLKNYLKIRNYYLFTPVQEAGEEEGKEQEEENPFAPIPEIGESLLPSWIVMDQNGHVILSFRFCYAKSGVFPRVAATCIMARYFYQPSRSLLHWNHVSIKEKPGEWILYKLNKNKEEEKLLVLSRGSMALYTYPCPTPLFDSGFEEENPTVKQTDLVPVLREFMDIQMGRKTAFTDARKDILAVLPKARKLAEDFRKKKLKKLPMAAPEPTTPSFLSRYEETRDQLARLLHFPDPAQYKPSKDSGPDPEFVDHCREDWLKPFRIHKVLKERQEYAAMWLHLYLSPAEDQRIHLIIAQCGTRALALQTLARMRFWEAEERQNGPGKLTAEEVAGQTNVSNKLVGDFSLYLKGGLDKFGNLSPNGPYSSIFFLRGTTAVGLVSDNPTRSVLPMARKLDAELKKLRNQKSKYREERPVRYPHSGRR